MKKFTKIFLISLASFLVLCIAAIGLAFWFVFTPEKLTPIVRTQADKFLSCQTEVEQVELTFFSTFPQFGLKVTNLNLINPMEGSPGDTLLSAGQFIGVVDAMALWNDNTVKLSDLSLVNGTINIFTNVEGVSNYNILKEDTLAAPEPETTEPLGFIDLGKIDLKNINLSYTDLSMNLSATVRNLDAKISGTVDAGNILGQIGISHSDVAFDYLDRAPAAANQGSSSAENNNLPQTETRISGVIANLSADISGSMLQDSIISTIMVHQSTVSLTYNGEAYLQGAAVQLNLPTILKPLQQHISFNKASASLNNLSFNLDGTVQNDTLNQTIITDLTYAFESWPIPEIMALVPPSYQSYLKGVGADGLLTSNGKIQGIYSETRMPVVDIHMALASGRLQHPDFPIALAKINSDVNIYADFQNSAASHVKINRLEAQSPKSTLSTTGMVSNLFSDMAIKLSSDAAVTLDEWNPLMPAGMNLSMKGHVKGKVKSDFLVSQAQNMELDKMKLSGNLTLDNLDVVYDSMWVKTDHSTMDFALPNHYAATNKTKFAWTSITTGIFEAGMPNNTHAWVKNATLSLETSDVRDTTRIPELICTFKMDSLQAGMDTLAVAIQNPAGKVSMAPRQGTRDQPDIALTYKGNRLEASMGALLAKLNKLNLETRIINDQTQDDIFLQWLVKGFVNMDQGLITTPQLKQALFIPAIEMNFEPEKFDIKESRIIISNSDFELKGQLNNVLSYFRGDSLLRGSFRFVSNNTDIYQLMNLTNGIGNEPLPEEEASGGPYMVPKGVDVLISTNIREASYLTSKLSDITGNVQVKDGILLLDELKFTSPAAKAQLTAMYRTPRKNHVFLGVDYHLLDVEIAGLLKMIPEIDTLMPMLRSFDGRGEFHMAIQTYLDSTYTLKKSTLLGAASLKGQNLVLMDGETFSMIAKKLMFKKKTENRIKKLFAEFTIFRDEIDVYPLLLEMDKYSAVVGGRHLTDLTYDYIISVVQSPLPFRLALSIKGNEDDFDYDRGKPPYAKDYVQVEKGVVASKQLELRKLIRESLTKNVDVQQPSN